MSTLDKFIEHGQSEQAASNESVTLSLRKLAINKDLRIFLTAICRYSKKDWADLLRSCKTLYTVAQSSLLITSDSKLMDEITRAPHFAALFARLAEDVD